jgi:MFS transporter, MHS family, proline/betaine transporter
LRVWLFVWDTGLCVFFSQSNSVLSLINALFLFSSSYLIRPLGSLFFGYVGDCYSVKFALNLSLTLMTIPTIALGLLPCGHNFSFLLLIALRLIQGFSAGGELPLSACYGYTNVAQSLRPMICGLVNMSSLLGVLLGSVVVFMVTYFLTKDELILYGWRIPFLLSIPMSIAIFYIRNKKLNDTNFVKNNHNLMSYLKLLNSHRKNIVISMILVAFLQVSFYILFLWMPHYLEYFLKQDVFFIRLNNALTLTFMSGCVFIFSLVMRTEFVKRVVRFSVILTSVVALFIFYASKNLNTFSLYALQYVAAFGISGLDAIIFYVLAQLFKEPIRCGGITFVFTLVASWLGGTAPLLCAYLIVKTGFHWIPALYIISLGLLTLFALNYLEDDSYVHCSEPAKQAVS